MRGLRHVRRPLTRPQRVVAAPRLGPAPDADRKRQRERRRRQPRGLRRRRPAAARPRRAGGGARHHDARRGSRTSCTRPTGASCCWAATARCTRSRTSTARSPRSLLPAGRANNIAHSLSIPIDLAAAARRRRERHAAPRPHRRERERQTVHALEGVSVGFHSVARSGYRGVNSADFRAGIKAAASTLARFEPGPVLVESDGVAELSSLNQLFVVNFPLFAFGLRVAPDADPGDGLLDLVAVEASSRAALVANLVRMRRGSHIGRRGSAPGARASPRLDRRPLARRRRHHHHRHRPGRDPPRAGRLLDREARTMTAVAATVDAVARPPRAGSRSSRSSPSPPPRPAPAWHAPSRRRTCRCSSTRSTTRPGSSAP